MITNAVLLHMKNKKQGTAEYIILNNDNVLKPKEININEELIRYVDYNLAELGGNISKVLGILRDNTNSVFNIAEYRIEQFSQLLGEIFQETLETDELWGQLVYSDIMFNFGFYDNTSSGIIRRCVDQHNAFAEILTMQTVLNNFFNTIGDDSFDSAKRFECFEKDFHRNTDNFAKVNFTSKKFDEYMFDPNSKSVGQVSEYYICTSVAEFYIALLYLHFKYCKRINVCKLCGKLFTPKTAKATAYCYGTFDGQKCQDLGPHIASREQKKNDDLIAEFERVRRKLYKEFYIEPDEYWDKAEPIIPSPKYIEFMAKKKKILADYRKGDISKDEVMMFLNSYR